MYKRYRTYVLSKPVDGPVLDSLVASYTDCCVDTGFGTDSLCTPVRTGIRSARSIRPLKSPNIAFVKLKKSAKYKHTHTHTHDRFVIVLYVHTSIGSFGSIHGIIYNRIIRSYNIIMYIIGTNVSPKRVRVYSLRT